MLYANVSSKFLLLQFSHYSCSFRKCSEKGLIAYDCQHEEEVLLCPYAVLFAGDNPMQAEECSHGGLKCNKFCRTCHVGGNQKYKRSDDGFLDVFKVRFYCNTDSSTQWVLLGWRATNPG